MLRKCVVCPRECGVNRMKGEMGVCRTRALAQVSSFGPHHGEERPLSGTRGSGTIFFANCNLKCVYCQNYDISQLGRGGQEKDAYELAKIMCSLQDDYGCHNINLVTPSHVVPQIVEAIYLAAQSGLRIPIVYNTSSYDAMRSLKLVDGMVDLYLADLKYASHENGVRYSHVEGYREVSRVAIVEMHRQVGELITDEEGIARRGLMIRHLVLPNDLSGTEEAMRFIAEGVSSRTFVNLMSQYRPAYQAHQYELLGQGVSADEFDRARQIRRKYGLTQGEVQSFWRSL